MPEFTVKEVRLPELHLPEIKRDEIVRALAGVHLPDVDLAKARRATIKIPAVTLSGADIDRLIAAGTAMTRFVRPAPTRVRPPWRGFGRPARTPIAMIVRPRTRRSRRPIVLAAIAVVALAIWAVMRRPAARQRLEAVSRDARERLATWRAEDLRPDAAQGENRPAEADTTSDLGGFANATDDAGSPVTGVNAHDVAARTNDGDGIPAFEESQANS